MKKWYQFYTDSVDNTKLQQPVGELLQRYLKKGISVAVTILPLDDETSESFPGLITSKP